MIHCRLLVKFLFDIMAYMQNRLTNSQRYLVVGSVGLVGLVG